MIISGMIIDTLHRAAQAREQGQSIESFVRKEMETRLTLLGSDHFDTFLLCNIHKGYNQELAIDIVSVYEKLRAEGKCRFIGASCHEFDRLLDFVLLGLPVDVVMFWHNFPIGVRQATPGHGAPDPGIVDAALQAIDDRGLGKIGMKSISWFQRATPFYHLKAPTHDAQAHRSAVAWQTQIPEVHSSMIAVDTPEQLDENLAALESAPDEGLLYEYLRKAQQMHASDASEAAPDA